MKVSENKPHSVHLRLTEEQYQFLKNDATMMGIGVSDYIRILINMSMTVAKKANEAVGEMKAQMQLGDLAHEDDKNYIEHII